MHARTIVLACHTDRPCVCFQIEELASCSSSIDAVALGYSHLLLRCEGEIRFKQILLFFCMATGDRLYFFVTVYFSEDARSNRTE